MKSNTQHKRTQQGASDTVTNVVAARNGHDTNTLTIPSRKDRRKMAKRISKRLTQGVGVDLFFDILRTTVDQMLDELAPGGNGEVSVSGSEVFPSDGGLTDAGESYVQNAFDSVISGGQLEWCDSFTDLAAVLDKYCFTYFMIERAAEKLARA